MYNLLLPKLDMPANRTNSDQIRCIAIITIPILHITAYTMTKSPTPKRKATLAAAKKAATVAAAKKAATAAASKAALQAEDQVATTTPNRKKRKVTTPTTDAASNAPAAKKTAGTKPPGKKPSASVETAKDQVTTTPAAKAASKGTAAEKTDGTKPADDTRAEDTAIPANDPPAEVVCTTTDDHRPMGPVGNNPTAITTADVAAVAEDEPQGTLVSKDAGSDAVPVSEDTGAGAHRPKGSVENNPTAIATAGLAAVATAGLAAVAVDEAQGKLGSKDAGTDSVPVSEDTAGAHPPENQVENSAATNAPPTPVRLLAVEKQAQTQFTTPLSKRRRKNKASTPTPTKSKAELAKMLEDKHCTRISVMVHPTMMIMLLPLYHGDNTIQVNMPNVNHNTLDRQKALQLTNNISGNAIDIGERKTPSFGEDVEYFFYYHERVSTDTLFYFCVAIAGYRGEILENVIIFLLFGQFISI
jgi:hypothetical protein